MPVLHEELEVARPIDEVWTFVSDFANSATWDPGVAEARKITEGPVRVGTRYELTVIFNGKRLPMTYEVTVYDPPDRVELRGTGEKVLAVDDIRFSSTQAGTAVHYTADLRLRGLLRLAEPLTRSRFDAIGKAAIDGMRRTLETGI